MHWTKQIKGVQPIKPQVLIYEPNSEGKPKLVGVEWFIPANSVDEVPTLFGQTFKGPMEGHEEGQPKHYELHVWTHRTNPGGIFAQFNTRVSCNQ